MLQGHLEVEWIILVFIAEAQNTYILNSTDLLHILYFSVMGIRLFQWLYHMCV